jgi:hypothetical protein
MRLTRDTVRIVVPPLLALGLVAALAHPADAAPVPPRPGVAAQAATAR